MTAESILFTEFRIQGLTLKNRITMAPMYLGYADCSFCTRRTASGKPAFCARWEKARRQTFLEKIDEKPEDSN